MFHHHCHIPHQRPLSASQEQMWGSRMILWSVWHLILLSSCHFSSAKSLIPVMRRSQIKLSCHLRSHWRSARLLSLKWTPAAAWHLFLWKKKKRRRQKAWLLCLWTLCVFPTLFVSQTHCAFMCCWMFVHYLLRICLSLWVWCSQRACDAPPPTAAKQWEKEHLI